MGAPTVPQRKQLKSRRSEIEKLVGNVSQKLSPFSEAIQYPHMGAACMKCTGVIIFGVRRRNTMPLHDMGMKERRGQHENFYTGYEEEH